MAHDPSRLVLFLHGWSVTSTSSYGRLPERLVHDAARIGLRIRVKDVFLGKYISFHNEVRLSDIAHAMEAALRARPIARLLEKHGTFTCITHSTGGPVAREWQARYYNAGPAGTPVGTPCPMRHLIMLAPANFGSALAQLGSSRLGRIKAFFDGVEPGTGVLDWLELGSPEAWALNAAWIRSASHLIGDDGPFPFVLTGQTIDRRFYDNLNSYTGETGSDGVIRVAAANLNAGYIRLEQAAPTSAGGDADMSTLSMMENTVSAPTPMLIVPGKAHVGTSKGIMRSVRATPGGALSGEERALALSVLRALQVEGAGADDDPVVTDRERVTVEGILAAMRVDSQASYRAVAAQFSAASTIVQRAERVEVEERLLLTDAVFLHDPHCMVIFRIEDDHGNVLTDFDILLTGDGHDENHLPRGFFTDRQRNSRHRGTITYYLNQQAMVGFDELRSPLDPAHVLRTEKPGVRALGLVVRPRPARGFVQYAPCEYRADSALLEALIAP
ncbi:MAG: hypothetical protein KC983_12445, partial [Phycisphaerales bacterium]|nr:hypothetical protein [Phycisphaerales bacterium]